MILNIKKKRKSEVERLKENLQIDEELYGRHKSGKSKRLQAVFFPNDNVPALMALFKLGIPNNFDEAICSVDADKWKCAMEDEMQSFISNKTFELVKCPEAKNIVGNTWIF